MPEIVETYIASETFSKTAVLQKQIADAYREDIRQYAEGLDQAKIARVFDSIPVHLSRQWNKNSS